MSENRAVSATVQFWDDVKVEAEREDRTVSSMLRVAFYQYLESKRRLQNG